MQVEMSEDAKSNPQYGRNASRKSALPGSGGIQRIGDAVTHSIRGFREGLNTEAAVKQEIAIFMLGIPLAVVVATTMWVWVALVGSLLLVLVAEFLNTAIERLCNHVTPEHNEDIRITKDLASAGVFFALMLAGLIWLVAIMDRLGLFNLVQL